MRPLHSQPPDFSRGGLVPSGDFDKYSLRLKARGFHQPDEVKAAIVLFFSLLDEKQRRLYAGLESLKFGHGGDRRVAELLDLDVGVIARGRQHLLEQDVEVDRVRRVGAGRKRVEKKHRKSSPRSRR